MRAYEISPKMAVYIISMEYLTFFECEKVKFLGNKDESHFEFKKSKAFGRKKQSFLSAKRVKLLDG